MAPAIEPPPLPKIPRRIGRFRIKGLLGEGAFGAVYHAHDPQLDRQVALKTPRLGVLGNRSDAERFLREARAAAQLRHPHIVPIFDADQIDGLYYIASAFIAPGRTLGELLREQGSLEPASAAWLIEQLASALDYAHSLGVVHRDIKPDNILLDEKGEPHIADFGLARHDGSDVLRTQDGMRMGTPAYMSPEQHQGRSHEADGRSDLWSLGVMLYQMVAGELPFQEQGLRLMYCVCHTDPAPLRKKNPKAPRDLETICLKCLAKAPEARYATCGELADDLRRWRLCEPVRARRVTAVERLWRWAQRNPAIALLISAVMVLLTTLGLGGLTASSLLARSHQQLEQKNMLLEDETRRATQSADDARQHRALAEKRAADARANEQRALAAEQAALAAQRSTQEALDKLRDAIDARKKSEQLSEEAQALAAANKQDADAAKAEREKELAKNRELSYSIDVNSAYQQWRLGNVGSARKILRSCPPEFRGWEWRYLDRESAGGQSYLPVAAKDLGFYTEYFRQETLLDPRELSLLDAALAELRGSIVCESADGRWAATYQPPVAGAPLQIYGFRNVDLLRLAPREKVGTFLARHPCISPTGSYLAGLGVRVEPILIDGKPVDHAFATPAVWRRDGKQRIDMAKILLGVAQTPPFGGSIGKDDLPEAHLWPTVASGANRFWAKFAFRPDENHVAGYFSGTKKIHVWSLAPEPVRLTEIGISAEPVDYRGSSASLRYSNDGAKLWVISPDRIDAYDGTTYELLGTTMLEKPLPVDAAIALSGQQDHFVARVAGIAKPPREAAKKASKPAPSPPWGVWEMESGRFVTELAEPVREEPSKPTGRDPAEEPPQEFAAAGDLSWFAVRSASQIQAWEEHRGAHRLTIAGVSAVAVGALRPGEPRVAVARGTQILVLDLMNPARPTPCRGHAGSIRALAFSPRLGQLASLGNDGAIRIWDAESGDELVSLEQPSARCLAFLPDGSRLIVGLDNGGLEWRDVADEGKLVKTVAASRNSIETLAVSPDRELIATGGLDRRHALWNVLSGEQMPTNPIHHDGEIRFVRFGWNGARLISAGNDGTIGIWDAATGELIRALRENSRDLRGIAFSSDPPRIIVAAHDKLNVWDPESGSKVIELETLAAPALAVEMMADESLLVADEAGNLRVWSLGVMP
jgi:hypothetical protein